MTAVILQHGELGPPGVLGDWAAARGLRIAAALLSEHFQHDEDQDRAAQAAAKQYIQKCPTRRRGWENHLESHDMLLD